MRSWHPINPKQIDARGLAAEHGEIHIILLVLAGRIKAWAHHPEVLRWKDHRRALIKRHNLVAAEMRRRGWNHGTPVHAEVFPPSTYRDKKGPVPLWQPLKTMRSLLHAKIAQRAADAKQKLYYAALKADKKKGVFE